MPPVSRQRTPRRPPQPLDARRLEELALTYVGRFATSRAKLVRYLDRKVRERGWEGEPAPDLDRMAERLASLGYVDDAAYAVSKARTLSGRGYGLRRVGQALFAAGIGEEEGVEARSLAHDNRVEAALKLARRRRIGPFANVAPDGPGREKAMAAMLRGGHGFALSRAIVDLAPGHSIDHRFLENLD